MFCFEVLVEELEVQKSKKNNDFYGAGAHLLLRSFAAPSQFQLWHLEALQLTYAKLGTDGNSKQWGIVTCL